MHSTDAVLEAARAGWSTNDIDPLVPKSRDRGFFRLAEVRASRCLSLSITHRLDTALDAAGSERLARPLRNSSIWRREMKGKDGSTTSPSLLRRVTNWADYPAWCDFCTCYDPLIHSWCRRYGLEASGLEDLCQEIWIKLADRMRTYQYDTGRTFRGWLRKFCHSRAIDLLRRRRAGLVVFLADLPAETLALALAVDATGGQQHEEAESRRSLLLLQAEQVQHAVRQRVEPQTWQAFWQIAVDGHSVRETADLMGMSYAAVFAAHKRVGRALRAEGKRRLALRYPDGPETIAPDVS